MRAFAIPIPPHLRSSEAFRTSGCILTFSPVKKRRTLLAAPFLFFIYFDTFFT